MKALVVTQFGQKPQIAIEERAKPSVKPGHTLVRMHAATVNPLSSQVSAGIVVTAKAPVVLSNDGSGIVEESDQFKPGARVAIFGGGQLGITEDGLQQQWVLVENKRIIPLPDDYDLDLGAALPINYVTAYQALTRVGGVKAGQTVLISGASGALGHALTQTAVALGATVIGIVSNAGKAKRALSSGASTVVDLSSENLKETVLEATNGRGADLAFDPVGGLILGQLLSALCTRGAVISIGFVGGMAATVDVADIVIYEKRVLGYDAWLETDPDVASALEWIGQRISQGALRPTIDSTYPMEQFAEAYQRLGSRQATGTILIHV
ncbi:zinc-binding alcohol dehydrogenase family protein [Pseudomonas syringae]|uniref:quinone oxidoreductase family protein n=1 Tax=Pseudomonas syringae TaxID=317 RepID=UPI00215B2B97|nr:zinc-binding alcohol dehydrogenase family protein [Pseudomonas syringae]MCR8720851.1 zinc-binding alcohol dehydrogenase family protein [Pseudomonas syringae]